MLIRSPRLSAHDIAEWERVSQYDHLISRTEAYRRSVEDAELAIVRWTRGRKGYVGVSWGKDSVCLASMCLELIPHWPLVWVAPRPMEQPDCYAVRDAFMRKHPSARYHEIVAEAEPNDIGGYHTEDAVDRGFLQAHKAHGSARISGIRATESRLRTMVQRISGGDDRYALSPMMDWDISVVWGMLSVRDLPIHPAYAMLHGGGNDRDHLRVGSMSIHHGGPVKKGWEDVYYPEYADWV